MIIFLGINNLLKFENDHSILHASEPWSLSCVPAWDPTGSSMESAAWFVSYAILWISRKPAKLRRRWPCLVLLGLIMK